MFISVDRYTLSSAGGAEDGGGGGLAGGQDPARGLARGQHRLQEQEEHRYALGLVLSSGKYLL